METISFANFQKLDLRVGEIREVSEVSGLDKIFKLRVDLGELGERNLLAGVRKYFKPEELVGLQIVVASNLEPKEIRGEISEGMLLAAEVGGRPILIMPCEKVAPGTKVR